MIAESVRHHLKGRDAVYHVIRHGRRFTAEETAHVAHVSGKRFAKAVLLRLLPLEGFGFVLAVIPAHERLDLASLGAALGRELALATEDEVLALFPGIEAGALPPIGELARVPVVIDDALRGGTLVFHGGTLTDLVEMSWDEFLKLGPVQLLPAGRATAAHAT